MGNFPLGSLGLVRVTSRKAGLQRDAEEQESGAAGGARPQGPNPTSTAQ